MRTGEEIQKAHDVLIAIVLKEVPFKMDKEVFTNIRVACDVLCWILEHDHSNAFEENLECIIKKLEHRGITFRKKL